MLIALLFICPAMLLLDPIVRIFSWGAKKELDVLQREDANPSNATGIVISPSKVSMGRAWCVRVCVCVCVGGCCVCVRERKRERESERERERERESERKRERERRRERERESTGYARSRC